MTRHKADPFGQKHYREGAIQRIGEARLLLRAGEFSGAIYLGGRAVEGMLRALIWKLDAEIRQQKKTLETGHDLRELFEYACALLPAELHDAKNELQTRILHVGRL